MISTRKSTLSLASLIYFALEHKRSECSLECSRSQVRITAIACLSTMSSLILARHEHAETFVSYLLESLEESPPLVSEHPSHEDRYLDNPSMSHSERRNLHGDLRESCVAALGSPSLIAAVLSSRRTYYCSSACVSQITDEFENTFNPVPQILRT